MNDDLMDTKDMINLNRKGGEFGDGTIIQKIIRKYYQIKSLIFLFHRIKK